MNEDIGWGSMVVFLFMTIVFVLVLSSVNRDSRRKGYFQACMDSQGEVNYFAPKNPCVAKDCFLKARNLGSDPFEDTSLGLYGDSTDNKDTSKQTVLKLYTYGCNLINKPK